MTQRFFFDLTDGLSTLRDEDGVLAVDLDEAITQAGEVIEETRDSNELSDGDEAWTLIIRGAAGETLMTLPVMPHDPAAALAS